MYIVVGLKRFLGCKIIFISSGKPLEDPEITIAADGKDIETYAPGIHETMIIDSDTLLVTSSVQSKPAVSFQVDTEMITPMCESPADACPGEVLCSMSTELKLEKRITVFNVNITLENLVYWMYQVQVGEWSQLRVNENNFWKILLCAEMIDIKALPFTLQLPNFHCDTL